ncbi:hypothetical protein PV08_11839 [Exophiala spinifera]|uniref:Uncharacterized protein n=1 Tax=Exophiala spinifera TaxID=91928 RepID=A0A0D2ATM1_9EURO|nr:uncharacterized protein PV08_11839 [Exophiala spinifera]KIW10063.1 hypothetical protein PV08_11839 [Exophiala spinifera]
MSDQDVSEIASIFAKPLTEEWTRRKTPYGFDKALQRAQGLPKEDTERILLDTGFKAWISYFLAGQGSSNHYIGRAEKLRAIDTLQKLSVESKKEVATHIINTQAHETVSAAIDRLLKRQENRSAESPKSIPGEIQLDLTLEQMPQSEASVSPNHNDAMTVEMNVESTTATREISNDLPVPSRSFKQQTVSDPPAQLLPNLFPEYMCSTVKKDGDQAKVEMVFPYTLGMVCMSLVILSSKIQHVAMELFGVHVESEDGYRVIIEENGRRLTPQPELVISGAPDAAISKLLGSDMGNFIKVSPARKKELKQGIRITRFVTMRISCDPQEDGILTINMGEAEGYLVKCTLFEGTESQKM